MRVLRHLILWLLAAVPVFALPLVICQCWWPDQNARALVETAGQVLAEERRKEKWEEYKIHIELYKYYLDIFLKASLALLGITGGILTFYFNDKTASRSLIEKALLLPFAFSLAYAGVYYYGAWLWCEVSITVELLRKQLGIERVPDIQILSALLIVFGTMFYVVGVALLWFMWRDVPAVAPPPAGTPAESPGESAAK